SIESLQAMADVQQQLQQMAHTFSKMRSWIIEVVAFEPVLTGAMRSLQPLIQLGNLRHMDPAELRAVLRTMEKRNGAQLAAESEAAPTEVSEGSAAVPAIGDAALAQ